VFYGNEATESDCLTVAAFVTLLGYAKPVLPLLSVSLTSDCSLLQQQITSDFHVIVSYNLNSCFSTGVPPNIRVPRVAARDSAETNRNCLRRNLQPQSYAVVAVIDTWIIAQGSMSNANIGGRFRCSKKVEKHRSKCFYYQYL